MVIDDLWHLVCGVDLMMINTVCFSKHEVIQKQCVIFSNYAAQNMVCDGVW